MRDVCDITDSYVRHDSFICATWLIHMCDTTHSYVRHDSVYRRIHMCDVTYAFEWHDSSVRVTWFHTCVMTHSYVWNDLFIHATWFIHTSDMFDCHVCNDSFIYVTWLHHICAIAHLYVCHNSSILVTRFKSATSLVWHDSFIYAPRRMVFCFFGRGHGDPRDSPRPLSQAPPHLYPPAHTPNTKLHLPQIHHGMF